ncbi:hypothetical protein [Thiomicrorhabdus xiamenensis]|uniref:Beta-barrel porin-2, OmpL-like. bbp2 n=1 Tax=Thiomicrorhabdus xiamenensis TaxID=2739063 RepID=A0A7D4T128_9GAMM|nr:hypothetical protein [Thiomicrorhabdus xiamenensis]QKI89622.1 hypothetical protein HQN79_08595 [Thiomicrorhabdus xiamenensis]
MFPAMHLRNRFGKPVSKLFYAMILASTLAVSPASAEVQANAFISQGFIKSYDSPFLTKDSEKGSLKLNEIGLNLNWIYNSDWRFSGQLLSQTFGDIYEGEPKIDYLLADYLIFDNGLNSAGIRAGRVKTPYGLYNDSRDYPSSRPGIFLPSAIYFEGLRDFMVSTDGVNLYSTHFLSGGTLEVDAYYGEKSTSDDSLELYLLKGIDNRGDINRMRKYGLNLYFEPNALPNLHFNYSYMNAEPMIDLDPAVTSLISNARYTVGLHMLSAQYQYKNHIFSSEYLDIQTHTDIEYTFQPSDNIDTKGHAYYFQWQWLPLPSLETWIRYSYYLGNNDKRDEDNLRGYSKVSTLALRWHILPELNFTAQYDHRQGHANIPIFPDYDDNEMDKHWSVLSGQLNYHKQF